ncbi:MurR/RpiR family transcriptional regulator [Devosia nitrariae]|uniref:Transcriptional regulator n=1 Tax=Devosia nitrariae TaxID=2071872 RepID=A0ABQ5W3T2_9HYPH|nr:MurR/RpiR family transcriptional regulator [Devosia nitrariae]GLQ54398.1 transcriptional regulator [Devosia nitrariae]
MSDLVGLLHNERDEFTRSEQILTDIVLADVDAVLNMSIVDLARIADVSPPTVTRFCRRLGCKSYAEFRVRLAQSRFIGSRYLVPPAGPQTARDIAQGVINDIQSTIYDTFDRIDIAALEAAAEAIVRASYIVAFGSGGGSSMMASEAETRLFRLGLKVSSTLDHQAQMMRAAGAPPGTVVLAFSMSGNNLPLDKALTIAGEYGHKRIVVTRSDSPVAEHADILLTVDRTEHTDILKPSTTRYAYLALIDILAQTVATRLGAPAVNAMRRIKHQLVINRDGDDTQPLGD